MEPNNGTGTNSESVVHGRAGHHVVGPVRSISRKIPQQKPKFNLRIATWNVGTMSGRAGEVVETLERRKIDICCVQETRWRGGSARMITGKENRYKFFWIGDASGFGGVGVLVVEKWIENVLDIDRIDSRKLDCCLETQLSISGVHMRLR